MALPVVLSLGRDQELLSTRNLVLRFAGYIVVSAHSIDEAVDRLQEVRFDLVLLCQSIPAKEKDRLTCWIRAFASGIPVVSVSGNLCPGDVVAGLTVGSDPRQLLRGIREVLIDARNSAARAAAALDDQEVTATQSKKPPMPGTGYKQQTETTMERFAPLARIG